MSKTIYIGGRLESKEKGNVVTGANAILDDTKGKKQNVINKETDDELARLEQSKQDNLNFDSTPTEDSTNPVTSGGVYTAEKALSDAIEAILLLIPSAATALNKLVDTNTMNSSISTATATFRGTYNAVSDLGLTYQATHAQIEAALDALGLTADNNDFAFVQIPVSDQSQDIAKTERFKFNGTNWLYEYDLNTSGFTAAQWAAINSGITAALVTKLTDLPTAAALQLALNAKQDTLTFDNEPTALSQNPVYSGGIYTAIQAVATALSDYSEATDGRLNTLEGLVPTEASSSNKLTDKAYVDGLIQAITELIPAEADTTNQLADKAYVLAQILAATPAFKGQFVTLAELQAVASPKAGDLGIVRTKDSDGMDVFTVYQYLNNAWNVFYSLSYHPQTKPATTGTTGDYPYNGMGRVELAKNMVNTGTELAPVMVNQLTQDMFYKGAVGSRVPNTNTIFVIQYDYVLAENITIPDNCVLEFDGGSISGAYTLMLAKTFLDGDVIILCQASGTILNESITPIVFGAKGDGITNDTTAFKSAVDVCDNVFIPNGTYIIDCGNFDAYANTGIVISRSNVHITMESGAILKAGTLPSSNPGNDFRNVITIIGEGVVDGVDTRIENVTIEGGQIIGARDQFTLPQSGLTTDTILENYCAIAIKFCNNVTIKNCTITDNTGDAIYTAAVDNIIIDNVVAKRCRRGSFSIGLDNGIVIKDCYVENPRYVSYSNGNSSYAVAPYAGVCFEPEPATLRAISDAPIQNCIIEGCTFVNIDGHEAPRLYSILGPCCDLVVRNNHFKNTNNQNITITDTRTTDPSCKAENFLFEGNVIDAKTLTSASVMNFCMNITVFGNVYAKNNIINGTSLGAFINFTNLIVENNYIDFDVFISGATAYDGAVNPTTIIKDNKGTAFCICTDFINAQEVHVTNNIMTGKANNLNNYLYSLYYPDSGVTKMIVEDNNLVLPVAFFVMKGYSNTGDLLIKNNIVEFTGTPLWFDKNGNLRYVKADIIGNYFKTGGNRTLSVGDFTLKMNVINNVFAGAETQFTTDTSDTDHLKTVNNVYLG